MGSGIFLLPAALAVYGGISIFGWLFTSIGALFLALVFSRLSKLITNAGGPYAYSKESFGDFTGYLVAWGYWVSIWCGNAAISVAGVGYLSVFVPEIKSNSIVSSSLAIIVLWLFTYINSKKIRSVGIVQLTTTILKIIPLLVLGTLGFLYFNTEHFIPFNLSGLTNYEAISATASLTLWAFLGLESATIPSDKVKNPKNTIPISTILGTLITAIIYISSTVAVMGIITPNVLQTSTAPFADAAKIVWGSWSYYAVALGAAISCFGALNGWILLQGQIPLAAAKDDLFPMIFKKTSKHGVPIIGIIISSVFASILVSMNFARGLVSMFSFMIMLSTLTVLLPYIVSTLAEFFIHLKYEKNIKSKQLLKSLIISIPAFLFSIWAVIGLGYEIILWGILLLVIGIPLFLFKKRKM